MSGGGGKKRGGKTPAKKKKPQTKGAGRKARAKPGKKVLSVLRWFLIAVAVFSLAGAFWFWYQHKPQETHRPVVPASVKPHDLKKPEKPVVKKNLPPKLAIPAPVKKSAGPKIAIIVDDLGGNLSSARTLLSIPAPINFAVLPHLAHSEEIAKMANSEGRTVLLHLPMEPLSKNANPGPGHLLVSMEQSQIKKTVIADLASVPFAVGVNNHMGSRFSADKRAMNMVLDLLKERDLFFIDSRTSAKTVAYKIAIAKGLPSASRDIFLDNKRDETAIEKQIVHLEKIAIKNGSAIAICHPYKETLAVLQRTVPGMQKRGMVFVPVTDLLVRGQGN